MLMGEAYDARLEMPGWDKPGFDDSGWMKVSRFDHMQTKLAATNGPSVRRIEELSPIGEPTMTSDLIARRAVFDLGQGSLHLMVGAADDWSPAVAAKAHAPAPPGW